jgi:hypothetical protein
VAELAALGQFTEVSIRIEPDKCWKCGMDIPATEDRCMNCHAPASGKTLQEDLREKGELESLKLDLRNIETLLAVLLEALAEDSLLKERINRLAQQGIPPFIDLLE